MSRILIVGSGDVGGNLAIKLANQGHSVWGLRRTDKAIGEGVTTISADVSEVETLVGKLPTQLDYVYYSVASPEFTEEGYHKYYVQGMKHILALLKQQNNLPKRIFFTSSTSVFPQHDGSWVDESSDANPIAFAGKKMQEAEEVLAHSGYPYSIIRFSGIYGPGRNRLINQARKGDHCDPEPDVWTNRIHRDDCVGVLGFLRDQVEESVKLDNLYIASDPSPSTLYEILEWLKDHIGDVEPDHEMAEFVTRRGSKRCTPKRLLSLGYKFKYENYQVGYEEILSDMGY